MLEIGDWVTQVVWVKWKEVWGPEFKLEQRSKY